MEKKNREKWQLNARQRERLDRILMWVAIVSMVWMFAILLNGGPHNVFQRIVATIGAISLIAVAVYSAYHA